MQSKILTSNLAKNFPKEVKTLFEIFGDDIRLVGGCVRDLLLKRKVNDFDFCTKFHPQDVIKILQKHKIKALPTGLKFGTVTAVVNGKNFEITTLRKDLNQKGRDCDVDFTDDYFVDAQRRDFTINALYLDAKGKIYDYFDGISDLKKAKVKFIGAANLRIKEDFLRILRFFRFSVEYGKALDESGLKSCILQKKNLKKLSRERIRVELIKMLQTQKIESLIEVLQVIKKEQILIEIFDANLQVKNLQKLLKISPASEIDLKIAAVFLNKKSNLKKFSVQICATNKEKKFFELLLKLPNRLDLKALNRLLVFYDKDFVIKFYLFYLTKKPNAKTLHLQYLQKFKLPKAPFSAQDLIKKGFRGAQISKELERLKINWADKGFVVT